VSDRAVARLNARRATTLTKTRAVQNTCPVAARARAFEHSERIPNAGSQDLRDRFRLVRAGWNRG
jgi:predicted amidohydrolase